MDKAAADKEMAMYDGKYTSSKSGRALFGGWSKEGTDKWKEVREAIDDVYKNDSERVVALQEKVLEEIKHRFARAEEPAKKKRKLVISEEDEDDVADFSDDEEEEDGADE